MSTHNIQCLDKKRTFPLHFFLGLSEEFRSDLKRVRISHGKGAIGVRAIEVRMYIGYCKCAISFCHCLYLSFPVFRRLCFMIVTFTG